MAAKFMVVSDDQHKAFINIELVCMFRLRKDDDDQAARPEEVEIEFIGGSKTKLHGETARHFLSAVGKLVS